MPYLLQLKSNESFFFLKFKLNASFSLVNNFTYTFPVTEEQPAYWYEFSSIDTGTRHIRKPQEPPEQNKSRDTRV